MRRNAFLAGATLALTLAACDTVDPTSEPGLNDAAHTDGAGMAKASDGIAKADVCHYDADAGTYHLINVATAALPAHRGHGDALPGEPVPTQEGYAFDEACAPVFVPVVVLQQLTPVTATYGAGVFIGSGEGEVEGPVIPVDINLLGDRSNTSGCEAADFAGLDFSGPNDIALVQRSTVCLFGKKVLNAVAAGAEAVVIFNKGDIPEREGVLMNVSLSGPDDVNDEVLADIPVVGASFDAGVALSQPGSTARVLVDL